jgi:gluconate 2-dehydrogenase gamma chain
MNLNGKRITRRRFLRVSSATLLSAPLIQLLPISGGRWRYFTAIEAQAINALCERIIPSDQDPGASWAGVVVFIDRQLMGYHEQYQELYRNGARGLDETSRLLHQKLFVELTPEQQDDLLRRLDSNQAPGTVWKTISAPEFFRLVIEHTMQGFYGGPRHGGNRDAISWSMLGLPTPMVRSRRPMSTPWRDSAKPNSNSP